MSGPNDLTIKLGLDDAGLPQPVQRVNAAIASIGKTGEISARQTAAAMRTLPAQFTDIATQLAGGQNPLLILLQQGGQIKDSFGGIGPAIAALGTFITPTAVAVAGMATGVGLLALAAHQGAQETKALRDTLAITGNAAGLTGARFTAVAEQVAGATQQTVGGAREIVMALASSGQVSNRVLDAMAIAVGRVADVTGGDSKKIAADFAGMAGGVAKWAAEHNKAWNFISIEQYKYIRRLEEQGKAEQAMVFVSEQITKHTEEQAKNLGTLERMWDSVGKAASGAWDSMLGLGRAKTTNDELMRLHKDLAIVNARIEMNAKAGTPDANPEDAKSVLRLRNEIELLRLKARAEMNVADAKSEAAAKSRKAIEDERKAEGAGTHKDKLDPAVWYDVLDARDGMIKAALAREKIDSEVDGFYQGVLAKAEERRQLLLTKDAEFVAQLVDANDRATIELLQNERQRGEALIALDRDIAIRRLQAQAGLGDGVRALAKDEIDRKARLALQGLDGAKQAADKMADDAGKATYEGVHGALTEAFRDTNDPLRAFGNALANVIFTRASRSLIDALATAAVGRDGQGGGLGSLLSLFTSGGSGADGASFNSGGVDKFANVPPLATGTNYVPRNMLAMLHQGEAVVPRQYNPAAGGAGGHSITFAPQISIDSRTDREQVLSLVYGAVQQAQQAMVEDLQARGVLA